MRLGSPLSYAVRHRGLGSALKRSEDPGNTCASYLTILVELAY
jgi:hypothetical protein